MNIKVSLLSFCAVAALSLPARSQVYQMGGVPASDSVQQPRTLPVLVRDTAKPKRKVLIPKPKPLNREFSGGIRVATDGWSVFAERGDVKTEESGARADMFHNVRLWTAEFTEHKDAQEFKSSVGSDPGRGAKSKPFIFGKRNNFYALKLGWAYRRMIAGKPEPGTVSVHWLYGGGLALGLEKPYYITATLPNGQTQAIGYADSVSNVFLNDRFIVGGASFTDGLSEIKFVPGVHFRTGLHFDFANKKKGLVAIETGVAAELYTRSIQLMVAGKERSLFTNIYASIQLGKRYPKKRS